MEQCILSALVPTKQGTLVWDTERLEYKASYITENDQNFAYRTSIHLALTWLALPAASKQGEAKGSGKGATDSACAGAGGRCL